MPRRIIVRPPNEDALNGIMKTENIVKVYSNPDDNSATNESIGTREMIFLCPVDENIRKSLFEIDPVKDEEIFNNLNTLGNYETEGFYCIFYPSASSNGTKQYSKKYIKKSEVKAEYEHERKINEAEFKHYRKKLAALMRGEVVVFNDSDTSANSGYIDYHLEVNNQTIIGRTNDVEDLHFGIFSDDCLIDNAVNGSYDGDNEKFFFIEDLEKAKYFSNYHIVELMEEAKYFLDIDFPLFNKVIDKIITKRCLKNAYIRKNEMFQTAIVRHLNSYAKLDKNEWIKMMEDESAGYFEKHEKNRGDRFKNYLSYKWLSKEIINELAPEQKKFLDNAQGVFSTFYHPIRFLAWLDEKMNP